MSIVLRTFFPLFTILSFYTKHMFKFIYVNQLIHMVILVDNVDKFVHNLIISGFADVCHVENFLQSFSLIHHGSTGFVHIARTTFSGLILPVSARTCLTLPILSDVYIKTFFLQLFMVLLLRAVLRRKRENNVWIFQFRLFSPHNLPSPVRQIVWLLLCTKSTPFFP